MSRLAQYVAAATGRHPVSSVHTAPRPPAPSAHTSRPATRPPPAAPRPPRPRPHRKGITARTASSDDQEEPPLHPRARVVMLIEQCHTLPPLSLCHSSKLLSSNGAQFAASACLAALAAGSDTCLHHLTTLLSGTAYLADSPPAASASSAPRQKLAELAPCCNGLAPSNLSVGPPVVHYHTNYVHHGQCLGLTTFRPLIYSACRQQGRELGRLQLAQLRLGDAQIAASQRGVDCMPSTSTRLGQYLHAAAAEHGSQAAPRQHRQRPSSPGYACALAAAASQRRDVCRMAGGQLRQHGSRGSCLQAFAVVSSWYTCPGSSCVWD
jgi:hypothetical protein